MKHLMLTTALTTATAFGAMAQTASGDMSERDNAQGAVPAFLSGDFTGKTLYTLDSDDARALGSRDRSGSDGASASRDGMAGNDRMRWTGSDTFLAGRDSWQDVGSIDDIVMTMDGEIRGVLLDVGGFLGFGTYQVMVDIEEIHFVTEDNGDAQDIDDFFVVIAMSQDQLENLPEWDEDQLRAGFDMRQDRQQGESMRSDGQQDQAMLSDEQQGEAMTSDQQQQDGTRSYQQDQDATRADSDQATATTGSRNGHDGQGSVFGDDHTMLEGEERTVDRLMGADVYDANGENIGSVSDLVLDGESRISDVVVDVGGFLGMGSHSVRLSIQDAQIGWSDTDDEARVQVSMTGDQLEDMPAHGS